MQRILHSLLGLLLLTVASAAESTQQAESFNPPAPAYDPDWDWLKLTSGEWLKGEVKSLYNDELEFDSDNLGIVVIDAEDIEQLITGSPMSVNIGNRQALVGRIVFKDQEVSVIRGEAQRTVPFAQVVSMTDGADREFDKWSAKVSLGANLRSGNTDQVEYNANVKVERRTALTRFSFEYLGNVNETNGLETANNHRADSYLDYYFSTRWFYRVANLEYFRDPFQNIEHRITASTGIGYTIVDTGRTEWDVLLGPGYQYSELETTNGVQGSGNFVGLAGTGLEWEINKRQDFTASYQITFTDEDSGGWLQNLTLELENEITGDLDFDITFIWDRIGDPITGSDGMTPEQDDFRLLFSLGYSL
ncbi:DUF481 domain-containing protein [Coraliomargarita akajimensis]|uniref:DUF481 domain-containing protein n=1 Tax=Coraliomargarita akajimensis (strain DSM 45221 / IAM 15411 / JCM 23193 / KCTC 12865 / 04OKA010-24) TaxID=583355 RepID=D5EPC1_CORAD|nr:DUF481 domain-containing protein [Coraliomargarita akajimensis]ADE55631.1 protein of unknown function DUF481 [Coraliomargarita akajimensis DSM 45221]